MGMRRRVPEDRARIFNLIKFTTPVHFELTINCDWLYGRYLASGADDSSIFMKVVRIEGGDVVCQAQNDSELSGLLTVLHSGDEAGSGGGLNLTDLPLLSDTDVAALKCALPVPLSSTPNCSSSIISGYDVCESVCTCLCTLIRLRVAHPMFCAPWKTPPSS